MATLKILLIFLLLPASQAYLKGNSLYLRFKLPKDSDAYIDQIIRDDRPIESPQVAPFFAHGDRGSIAEIFDDTDPAIKFACPVSIRKRISDKWVGIIEF